MAHSGLRAGLGATLSVDWGEREAILFGSQHDGGRQGCVWVRPGSPVAASKDGVRRPPFFSPPTVSVSGRRNAQPDRSAKLPARTGVVRLQVGADETGGLDAGQVVPIEVAVNHQRVPSRTLVWSEPSCGLVAVADVWRAGLSVHRQLRGSIIVNRIDGWEAIDVTERPILAGLVSQCRHSSLSN